jgi:hypothetical protein
MSDANHPDPLIDSLTAVLTPVRRLRQRDGALLVVAASALCVGMVAVLFGLRADVAALNPARGRPPYSRMGLGGAGGGGHSCDGGVGYHQWRSPR